MIQQAPAAGTTHHPTRLAMRRGSALVVAILLAAIIALLTISAEISSGTPLRVPTGARQALRADAAALSTVGLALDAWPITWRQLTIGGSDTRAYTFESLPTGNVTSTLTVTRESNTMYRFDVLASSPTGTSRRSVHGQRPFIQFPWGGVIVTLGTVTLNSTYNLDGIDTPLNTAQLNCPSTGPNVSGLYLANRAQLVSDDSATYYGSAPTVAVNSALTAAALSQFGGKSVQAIINQANLVYPPGTVVTPTANGGTDGPTGCSGWGYVYGTDNGCEQYYPVIYAQGTLVMNGGYGQGIIVADGTVTLQNNAVFSGVIVLRHGGLVQTGTNTLFFGRLIGLDPTSTISLQSGWGVNSTCSISHVNDVRQLSRPVLSTQIADLFQGRDNR